MAAAIVFWIAAALILMTYIGYPALLALLAALRRKSAAPAAPQELPMLTALVVAHNEERGIITKTENILENGYPGDRLEVIVCSDGSTDRTNELVQGYGDPRVRLVASPTNVGVNAAFSLGAKEARGQVFLMTDSGGGLFEKGAILKAARHFTDPKVGFVSGRIFFENPLKSAIGSGYRSYWKIETVVRQLESRLDFITVTVGIFEMVRKEAYLPVPSEFNNDMAAPVYARSLGYKCRYEPEAAAVAQQTKKPGQDLGRRVRMAVRGWSSIPFILRHVPFLRNIGIWLALICHKYLRWTGGLFLLAALVANLFLLGSMCYQLTFASQLLFYGLALAGWILAALGRNVPPFSLCFYFCLLQLAGVLGLLQALRGRRIGVWKPVD